ncbi:MAG: hypothetical protein F6J87_15025 [Spirulina sp. SIO3F2]|nr:hypothetical protein [Spirulina sp. SIO3F2]
MFYSAMLAKVTSSMLSIDPLSTVHAQPVRLPQSKTATAHTAELTSQKPSESHVGS